MGGYGWTLKLRRKGFDPDQPRVPAGDPQGGQWTSGGGSVGSGGIDVRPEAKPLRDRLLKKMDVKVQRATGKDEWPRLLMESNDRLSGESEQQFRDKWTRMARYMGGQWIPEKDVLLLAPDADAEIALHEEGHAIFDRALTAKERTRWHKVYGPDEKHEMFAHSYSRYMRGEEWDDERNAYFDSLTRAE